MHVSDSIVYEASLTADGTPTFWHPGYREHYHSRHGALREAQQKFVAPSDLAQRLRGGRPVALLDICFGLSYNSFAASMVAHQLRGGGALSITALEIDPEVVRAAVTALAGTMPAWWLELVEAARVEGQACHGDISLAFRWGDARATLGQLAPGSVDLVYHDPFSTQRTPQLWSLDFFRQVRRRLRSDGCLLTYSQAASVRSGLVAAGFEVGHTQSDGTMRDGTAAVPHGGRLVHPLVAEELTALAGPKGEPYRDAALSAAPSQILRERQGRVEARRRQLPD
jgi:tRNA U34 5-methylaminomethyl-2-thiouridine-forming methyltransferase MnmC